MKHYSTLDYLSNEVSFANFYKHCLEKFEEVSEVSLILIWILNKIHINKQPNDSILFSYTQFVVHNYTYIVYRVIKEYVWLQKQKGASVSKVVSQLLTVINLQQCTEFLLKSFSIVPHFFPPFLFFPMELLSCKQYQKTIKHQT